MVSCRSPSVMKAKNIPRKLHMCSQEEHFACIFKEFKDYLPPRTNPKAQVKKHCLKYSECFCITTLSDAPKGNSPYTLNTGFGGFKKPHLSALGKVTNYQWPKRPSSIPASSPLPLFFPRLPETFLLMRMEFNIAST